MSQLEDHRRTVANKVDGTTEDFVERLHSLDHNKQKRMLDGTVRQGETWFKDAQGQEECKATNTNNHNTDSKQPHKRLDNSSKKHEGGSQESSQRNKMSNKHQQNKR